MQQLRNASDPVACAAGVLEAVLDVMLMVREQTARRHSTTCQPGAENGGNGGKAGVGPTLIHMRAMGVLRKRPGATLSVLSDQLALTLSATSRLVECLVAKGLVARVVPEGNRRTVSLQLTPAGEKARAKAFLLAQRELAKSLQTLTAAERQTLHQSMARLSQAIATKPNP
jgi:DNA-binding MarR family transcriptional regulator